MRAQIKDLIDDVLEAHERISSFVSGYSFADYVADEKTRLAVERCLEIMSEALTRMARIDPGVEVAVRDYRDMRSFRNILVHDYGRVDDRIVWTVLHDHLPRLVEDVKSLRS
ncbi:MAG: DUF86 domain-containing protein [Verrucomicrobiota bacterium JB022]|nr:DUF86 domain-containing protein [Verrucomicrobiota bacterium JB022]